MLEIVSARALYSKIGQLHPIIVRPRQCSEKDQTALGSNAAAVAIISTDEKPY